KLLQREPASLPSPSSLSSDPASSEDAMMDDIVDSQQQSCFTAKNSCSESGVSCNATNSSTNGSVCSDVDENGHLSPEPYEHIDSNINNNINNNNNNNNNSNSNGIISEQEVESHPQHSTNGLPSDASSPVSGPPSPPLCQVPPHRLSSPDHSHLNNSGHYHQHFGPGLGPGYYLSTSTHSLGYGCMTTSPSSCASPPGSYPSSNASHSGGSGTHSRGDSPGEGDGPPPIGGQHVVHVHVNPGETFSVRLGDQIQHIQ
ncbi:unnamed protein product, partial [Candidula unifasciata]